jgi:hypothetical protein
VKSEDMTREQLIDELAQVRQEISNITHSLNNTLVGVLGNISMAMGYHERGTSGEQVMQCLESAENTFVDIRELTTRMFDLALDGE